jgi:hypothetical protein
MRPFTFLCVPLLMLVTACASAPRPQPSILDVLDQSEHHSPAESPIPTSSKDCPVGTVSMCVAETRAGLRSNCACVNNADAMNALRGTARY